MKLELDENDYKKIAKYVAQLLRSQNPEQNVLLDLNECATLLNVSKKYLYTLTSARQIPFKKLGNKQLRFSKKEIEAWRDSQSIPQAAK